MKIRKEILDKVKEHAKSSFPIEACGYLASKDGVVTDIYKMTNVDDSTEHFSFDPQEQISVYLDSKSKGLKLDGVYHSHPYTPARPSPEDIKLAYDPNISYVIASLAQDEIVIKSFRIVSGEVTQEEIEEIENELL